VLDSLADISQQLLFRSCKLQTFQSVYCKELGGEEHYVGVVIGTSSMVCPVREHVRFIHQLHGSVTEREVGLGEVEGPVHLSSVELFGCREILEVLVVHPYLAGVFGAFNEVPPLLQRPDDSEHLLVVDLMVAFDWG